MKKWKDEAREKGERLRGFLAEQDELKKIQGRLSSDLDGFKSLNQELKERKSQLEHEINQKESLTQ